MNIAVNARKYIPALLGRLRRCERGAAAIELAFVASAFVALFVGAYDFGNVAREKLRINNAARAGAQYAMLGQVDSTDLDRIIQAVRDDAGDNALDVSARNFCSCSSGGEVACSTSCSDGEYAPFYVEISARKDVPLLFNYPGVTSPQTVAATVSQRTR